MIRDTLIFYTLLLYITVGKLKLFISFEEMNENNLDATAANEQNDYPPCGLQKLS